MTTNAGRRRFGPDSIWPEPSQYWDEPETQKQPTRPKAAPTVQEPEPAAKPRRGRKPKQQEKADTTPPQSAVEEETSQEPTEEVDLKGFQVVRREFFAHTREPAIIFNDGKISVNTACVRKMPDVEYIQILINRETRQLAINPCNEDALFCFQWGMTKEGKRFPKPVTGRLFFLKLCDLMGWNAEYRYKVLGRLCRANGRDLFVFDLASCETYERSPKDKEGKRKTSRVPIFPVEWKDQFGIPFEEQHKALQINMFDGFTLFSLKEARKTEPKEPEEEEKK